MLILSSFTGELTLLAPCRSPWSTVIAITSVVPPVSNSRGQQQPDALILCSTKDYIKTLSTSRYRYRYGYSAEEAQEGTGDLILPHGQIWKAADFKNTISRIDELMEELRHFFLSFDPPMPP